MKGKGALVKTLTGLALVYSLFGLLVKNANAIEFVLPSGVRFVLPDETTRQSNPQQPQKTKSEFTLPELPYCRIKKADWSSVVIDYWDKKGEKHTYSWVVERPFWYSDTGASVDLVYPYRLQNDGTRDFEGLEECLIRAGKKVLKSKYYGGSGTLYLDEVEGYPFDKMTIYYTTYK